MGIMRIKCTFRNEQIAGIAQRAYEDTLFDR